MKMDIAPDRNCHRCGGLGWVSYGCIPNAGDPKCDCCWRTKTSLEVETEAADEDNRPHAPPSLLAEQIEASQ